MNEELLEQIKQILSPIADKISYFYEGGSRLLNFINTYNDHDIICVCRSDEDRATCKRWLIDNGWLDLKQNKNLDFNFTTADYQETGIYESYYPYLVKERVCYKLDGSNFTETISFEEFLTKKAVIKNYFVNRIAMLDATNRGEGRRVPNNWKPSMYYIRKIWYCLYITNCIFKNNSWDLTEEQIQTVNLLHDWHNLTMEIAKPIVDKLVEDINNL